MNSVKRKSIFSILVLGSFLLLFNQIFWSSLPALLFIPEASWKLSAGNIFHLGTLIGINLILLAAGYLLADRKHAATTAVKFWMYTVILSFFIMIALFIQRRSFWVSRLYNYLWPLLRSTYPTFSGVILGLIALPALRRVCRDWSRIKLAFIFGVLFVAPTIFSRDIFHYNTGNRYIFAPSVTFSFVMFAVGVALYFKPLRMSTKKLWGAAIITWLANFLLAGFMPFISAAVHDSLTSANRFDTPATFMSVLGAIFVFTLLQRMSRKEFNPQTKIIYWVLGILLLSDSYETISVLSVFNTHYRMDYLKIGLSAAEALIIMIGLLVYNYIGVKLPVTQRVAHWADKHFDNLNFSTFDSWITENWTGFKAWARKHKAVLWALLGAYILSFLSFFIINNNTIIAITTSRHYNEFLYIPFARQQMILLNAAIIIAIFGVLWGLTNRFWFSSLFTGTFVVIWSIANRVKIAARNEPIMPSEVKMVKAFGSLMGMVSPVLMGVAVVFVLLIIALIIYLERKKPVGRGSHHVGLRITALILSIVFLGSSMRLNHQDSLAQTFAAGFKNKPKFQNQLQGVQMNGPLLQFMNNLDVKTMDRPYGYSKATMERIVRKYEANANQINKTRTNYFGKQTIIFNLSESYSDPRRVPGVQLAKDPMPVVEAMKRNTTSGIMISSGYGGGTANMEYMTLTGFTMSNLSPTMPTPYTQLVPFMKQASSINQAFPVSTAIHPYIGVYYSRPSVYKKFKFDRFYYLGSKYPIKHQWKIDRSPYMSDKTAYANALDQINRTNKGQFINLVTMQNHYPFDKDFYNGTKTYKASGTAVGSDEVEKEIEDFSMGVHYTDQAVKEFTAQLDKIKKPITWVFYGDHLPGIYADSDMSTEGLQLHETDYFIYSNKYARQHGSRVLRGPQSKTAFTGPNNFIALAQEQTNSKVSGYGALLLQVQKQLPVMSLDSTTNNTNSYNSATQFTANGKIVPERSLTPKQKELYHDFKLVQYDITSGKQYLLHDNFMKEPQSK